MSNIDKLIDLIKKEGLSEIGNLYYSDIKSLYTSLSTSNNYYIGDTSIREIENKLCIKFKLLSIISYLLNLLSSSLISDDLKKKIKKLLTREILINLKDKLVRNLKINFEWINMQVMDLTPELPELDLTIPSLPSPQSSWPIFNVIYRDNSNSLKFCNKDGSKNFIIEPSPTFNDPYLPLYDEVNSTDSVNYNCKLENDFSKTYIIRIHPSVNKYVNDDSYKDYLIYYEYLPTIYYHGKINFNYKAFNMPNVISYNLIPNNQSKYSYTYTIINQYKNLLIDTSLNFGTNLNKLEFLINFIKLLEKMYKNNKLLQNFYSIGVNGNMPVLLDTSDKFLDYVKPKSPHGKRSGYIINIPEEQIQGLINIFKVLDLKGKNHTDDTGAISRMYSLPDKYLFSGTEPMLNKRIILCDFHISFELKPNSDPKNSTQLNYIGILDILEWIRDNNLIDENP